MAQQLAEILASLDGVYNPRKQVVQQQLATLPGQEEAAVGDLSAARDREYGAIDVLANDRGLSYSGKPLADRGTYQQTTFLPGRAAIKSDYANRGFQLQGALSDLEAERTKQAYGIYNDQYQADRAKEAAIAAEQSRARAAAAANPGLNFGSFGQAAAPAAQQQQSSLSGDPKQAVAQLFQDYAPGKIPYYTENYVLPKMVQILRAAPGYSPYSNAKIMELAKSLVFNYRKQNFGE